jgi:5-methyltetrahydrofolate--homocysteine methyltransferase
VGLFVLSAGFGAEEAKRTLKRRHDDYNAVILSALSDSLAEALSLRTHNNVCVATFGKNAAKRGRTGIRPAFGYAGLNDHTDKKLVCRLLDAQSDLGITLTSSAMLRPAASVCGIYILNPEARYFSPGKIAGDQLEAWAAAKKITIKEALRRSGNL